MKMLVRIISLLTVVCLFSCGNRILKRTASAFIEYEIVIPEQMNAIYKGQDTVLRIKTESPLKMIIYYDSMICSSCKIKQLYQWEEITALFKVTKEKFVPIFIFAPSRNNSKELARSLKASQFNYPLFIDKTGDFRKINPRIPDDNRFHVFLLDENNKIVLFGDPMMNDELWKLYKSTIKKLIENDGVLPQ